MYQRLCDVLPTPRISQTTLPLACFAPEVVSLDESTLDALARSQAPLRSLAQGDPQLTSGQIGGSVGCASPTLAASPVPRRCFGRLLPPSRAALARLTLRQPDLGRSGLLWLSLVGSVKSTGLLVRLTSAGEWLLCDPTCLRSRSCSRPARCLDLVRSLPQRSSGLCRSLDPIPLSRHALSLHHQRARPPALASG